MIDREPRPLRAPRPVDNGPLDDDGAEHESLLEPGALRERFALVRRDRGHARPRRWLTDLIGQARAEVAPPPVPAPAPLVAVAAPAPQPQAVPPECELDPDQRAAEQWMASRHDELEQRLTELESIERNLELREHAVLRREEAAARWFTELNRMQRLIEEKRRRLEPFGSAVAD